MEQVFFYIFAVMAIVSAIAVISVRNPVHSALFLIVCFFQVAAIFVLLRAPFLAAMQVFIYAGAVMVLFLFAVLVLDVGKERLKEHIHSQGYWAVIIVLVLVAMMGYLAVSGTVVAPSGGYDEAALARNTEVIGRELFTRYIFPFEVVSVVLLVAFVGAIALVMKEKGRGG
jgi:NADH-quinone oxidoreductase subunit J